MARPNLVRSIVSWDPDKGCFLEVRVEAFGAEVLSTEVSAGTCVAAEHGHSFDLAILLSSSGRERLRVRVFGRRWLGGIGGVLVEALLRFIDLFLQGLQLPLILLNEGRDRRLCGRRDLVPKFSRNGWLHTHATDLQTQLTEGKVGLGTSTPHCSLVTLDP